MNNLLLRHNVSMHRQLALLLQTVNEKKLPAELELYKQWLIGIMTAMQKQIGDNLVALKKGMPELYPDILSDTELLSQQLGFLNSSFIPPVHRSIGTDIIGLKLLNWLHKIHPNTRQIPFAIADGSFSIYPVNPTLYYLPIVEQKGLLFLPLFFHEFGHLLFTLHRPEMENLVKEIQLAIEEFLRPAFVHNDQKNEDEWKKNAAIVSTWYKWAQELYCDAVGLIIGGESYLLAFSNYFQMGGRREFHMLEKDLKGHSHPITAIRIRFLLRRARKMGYVKLAESIEEEWNLLRINYSLGKEYYGYFIDDYTETIESIIDDMLVQASPVQYSENILSPVKILNVAWSKFMEDAGGYPDWEIEQIESFLITDFLK
jgi:hypothetical protein